ncbi:uncharacterized protein [Misgurnus anguillicaudatus]
MNREDMDCCESSVYVTDDGSLDSVWMSRDQSRTPQTLLDSKLSEEKSRHTQDSDLSLTLLCYTESKLTDTQDTTVCDSKQSLQEDQTSTESLDSVCNAGEQQQILQTKLKMCSVKLIDCTNLMMKIKTEPTEMKTEPTEMKTEPTEMKTEPTEIKTEPTEIKTEPTEIKTEPTEIKTEPTEIKTEPTEEEDRTEEDDDFIPSGMSPWASCSKVIHLDFSYRIRSKFQNGLFKTKKWILNLDWITKSNLGFDLDKIVTLCWSKHFSKIGICLIPKIRIILIPSKGWISGTKM